MTLETAIETYGYWALALGTFLEGETILVIAGFMAHRGYLELHWVIVTAFIGSMAGDQLFFFLGVTKGKGYIAKRPKWQARADLIRPLLARWGDYLVLVFRFLYGLRNIIPFIIGATGYSPKRFFVLNVIGAVIWAVTVGLAGYLFGEVARQFIHDLRQYEGWVVVVLAIAGPLLWILLRLRRRQRERRKLADAATAAAAKQAAPVAAAPLAK